MAQPRHSDDYRRRLLAAVAAFVIHVIGIAAVLYASPHYWKQDYHTSALTGEAWVNELIYGHPDRIWIELGMRVHVFLALVAELRLSASRSGPVPVLSPSGLEPGTEPVPESFRN
jgi:hypothetical protein